MSDDSDEALLAALLQGQTRRADVPEISPERIQAIAAGAPITETDMAVLLRSPSARAELDEAIRLRRLLSDIPAKEDGPANDNILLPSRAAAAGTTSALKLTDKLGRAHVLVWPGHLDAEFFIRLRLDGALRPGQPVNGIYVEIREAGVEGRVVLSGRTGDQGELSGTWPHAAGSPFNRDGLPPLRIDIPEWGDV